IPIHSFKQSEQKSVESNKRNNNVTLRRAIMQQSKMNQTHIRFTEEEYARVLNDAEAYGKTVPEMIKSVYFGAKIARPTLSHDDAQRIIAALGRIGNNVNQIA